MVETIYKLKFAIMIDLFETLATTTNPNNIFTDDYRESMLAIDDDMITEVIDLWITEDNIEDCKVVYSTESNKDVKSCTQVEVTVHEIKTSENITITDIDVIEEAKEKLMRG